MMQALNMVKTLAKTTKRQEWAGLAAVRCRKRVIEAGEMVATWRPSFWLRSSNTACHLDAP